MEYNDLVLAALNVRDRAYAPYSSFAVGAAVLTKGGSIFAGCNIENVSFGLTICAERSAIAAAVAEGHKDFVAIAVVTDLKEPAFPCGACRQVLAEFNPSMQIIAATVSGERKQLALDQLLPRPLKNLPDKSADV